MTGLVIHKVFSDGFSLGRLQPCNAFAFHDWSRQSFVATSLDTMTSHLVLRSHRLGDTKVLLTLQVAFARALMLLPK